MNNQPQITEEDFSAWKDNPITRAVIDYLASRKDMAYGIWMSQVHDTQSTKDQVELLRVELRAKLEFIEDFIELKLEDIQDNDTGANVVPIEPAKRTGKPNRTH